MADIKTRKKKKGIIKKFDRLANQSKKRKENLVSVKEKNTYNDEENVNEYGGEKIIRASNVIIRSGAKIGVGLTNKIGKVATKSTIKDLQKLKNKMNENKLKKKIKKNSKKNNKKIKTVKKFDKLKIKKVKKTGKGNIKLAKKALQIAKATAKATVKTIKFATKATILAIKGILLALKFLIMFLIAGGWIVLLIIIVIASIAMLVQSIFGIFFSSEDTNSKITVNNEQQIVTMDKVISELNQDFINRINQIQKENPYDEFDINSSKVEWKDVLAIYTVKLSEGNDGVDVVTIDDEKVEMLKSLFWEMNEVTFSKDEETHEETRIGLFSSETVTITKVNLHIVINGKSAEEMADIYNFNAKQRQQLAELTDPKYSNMWANVIYGSSRGSSDIVRVAEQQIGNVGGKPYWSWYGFKKRVSWCACFVSWCANECRLYRSRRYT